jgi:crossover junction endodeoxyribonuclease RuvC
MRLFCGIDPGVTGAVATHCPDTGFFEVFDAPFFELRVGGKMRKRVDIPSLIAMLSDNGADRIVATSLEMVNGRPGDTPTTAFTLGEAYGVIRASLAAAHVPYEIVPPVTWKRHFKLGGKASTDAADAARELASRLLPEHASLFRRKMDHNRADAALLAIYTARVHSAK